jgi:hypothetical protein
MSKTYDRFSTLLSSRARVIFLLQGVETEFSLRVFEERVLKRSFEPKK